MLKTFLNNWVIPPLAFCLITLISLTLRYDEERGQADDDKPHLLTMWHGQFFFMTWRLRQILRFGSPVRPYTVLTSPSRDGAILARTIALFGYGLISGSSFKNPRTALREMKRRGADGTSIIIMGDGSRGPRHKMQSGSLMVSKMTGMPVATVAVSFSRHWQLNSWDRFLIPKPFCRALVLYGETVICPRNASSDELEQLRAALGEKLFALTEEADSRFRNHA